jgi:hypothetical protein
MAASIFIASIVAIAWPASTVSPAATFSVTTPENGAGTCPGLPGSAFSADFSSTAMLRSRTAMGRIWPLRVVMTLRMPFSSASPIASRPT